MALSNKARKFFSKTSIDDLIAGIDLSEATNYVIDLYHSQGYHDGKFEEARFVVDRSGSNSNPAIQLEAPLYAKFLLFGTRGRFTGLPGRKMPPISAISSWIDKYCSGKGMSPWAVATKIRDYGTKPHDFITPNLSVIVDKVRAAIVGAMTKN